MKMNNRAFSTQGLKSWFGCEDGMKALMNRTDVLRDPGDRETFVTDEIVNIATIHGEAAAHCGQI